VATREIPDDLDGRILFAQELELIAQKLPTVVRGLAIQNELGDIGQGDGVAARNASHGDELEEIAEEAIDALVLHSQEWLCHCSAHSREGGATGKGEKPQVSAVKSSAAT